MHIRDLFLRHAVEAADKARAAFEAALALEDAGLRDLAEVALDNAQRNEVLAESLQVRALRAEERCV